MYLFLFLLILVSIVPGQSLDKGWKGIEPLKTSKAEVEKILGKPEIDDNGYHGFRTAQGFIQVNYSTEPCRPNAYNRGRFNVPKDKVLDYIVNLTTPIRLTQLDVKLAELDRESNDLEGLYHYSSRDGSVFITTSAENGVEYVGRIVFRPKNTDAKKYPCKG